MMKPTFGIIILFFVFFSCSMSVKEDHGSYVQCVNLDVRPDSVLKIAEVKCIPLETNEESLLHEMSKIICRNKRFYVFDRKGKSILIFDNKGSFMRKIHSVGGGPNEYLEPSDIDVDCLGNIYVSDNPTKRILVFSELQRKVINIIPIDKYFWEFAIADSGFIYLSDVVSSGKMNIKLAKYNSRNKHMDILEESDLDETGKISRFSKHYFYRSNDKLFYYKRFNPYIYSISGSEKIIRFKIESEHFPSEDKIMQWKNKGIQDIMADEKYIRDISACYETDNSYFIVSQTTPSLYTVINKSTNQICNTYFLNDKRLDNCTHLLSSDGEYYVSSCLPTSKNISNILSENNSIDSVCLNRIAKLTEDSNPILMLFRFE